MSHVDASWSFTLFAPFSEPLPSMSFIPMFAFFCPVQGSGFLPVTAKEDSVSRWLRISCNDTYRFLVHPFAVSDLEKQLSNSEVCVSPTSKRPNQIRLLNHNPTSGDRGMSPVTEAGWNAKNAVWYPIRHRKNRIPPTADDSSHRGT